MLRISIKVACLLALLPVLRCEDVQGPDGRTGIRSNILTRVSDSDGSSELSSESEDSSEGVQETDEVPPPPEGIVGIPTGPDGLSGEAHPPGIEITGEARPPSIEIRDGVYPPGARPDEPEGGVVPPFGQQLGARCPFPPDQNGRWPAFCFDIIGDHCQCFYDDIVVNQIECVLSNRTEYEHLASLQMDIERDRDVKRLELGLSDRPQAYTHIQRCLHQVDDIFARYGNLTGYYEALEEDMASTP